MDEEELKRQLTAAFDRSLAKGLARMETTVQATIAANAADVAVRVKEDMDNLKTKTMAAVNQFIDSTARSDAKIRADMAQFTDRIDSLERAVEHLLES